MVPLLTKALTSLVMLRDPQMAEKSYLGYHKIL